MIRIPNQKLWINTNIENISQNGQNTSSKEIRLLEKWEVFGHVV